MTQVEYERLKARWTDDLKAAGVRAPTGPLLAVDDAVGAMWSTYQGSKLGLSIVLEMIDRWRATQAGGVSVDKTSLAITALERSATALYHGGKPNVNARGPDFGQKVISQRALVLKDARLPLKVKYDIEQKQQWPGASLQDFKWPAYLEVSEHGSAVLVRVYAAYDTGRAANASIKQSMKNVIESYWNVAKVNFGDGRRDRDLLFDLTWVDGGSGGPHHSIAPKTTPSATPPKLLADMDKGELKAWRDEVAETRGAGANMGTWDVDDRVEVIHEFGHMIGNPDEYYVKSFGNVPSTYRAEIYDQPGFSTDSIMNNTDNYDKNNNKSYGKIHLRHFDTVKRAIGEYLACTGRADKIVTIVL
jgi:hypothetical protein